MFDGYSEATTFEVEGARVAIIVCETCGAAILCDPRDQTNRPQQHTDWHASEGFQNPHEEVEKP